MQRYRMSHPRVEGTGGPVTERQFREVWQPRGWRLIDGPPADEIPDDAHDRIDPEAPAASAAEEASSSPEETFEVPPAADAAAEPTKATKASKG